MDPLVITILHSLSKEEAVRRLRPALGRTVQMFPVLKLEHEQWTDERMDFRLAAFGQFVTGNMLIGDKDVRIEVTLPWLLAKFPDAVQEAIILRTRVLLDKK